VNANRPSPLVFVLLLAALGSAGGAEPLRLAGRAFDRRVEIEVRDLGQAAAKEAIEAAFHELPAAPAELAAIAETAARGVPVQLDAPQTELVRRAIGVCIWSEGSVGPLGGRLFELWGLRVAATSFPTPAEIEAAVGSARCDRASLDLEKRVLTVAAGSRLDFFPFAVGWGVDRAAARLRAAGSRNFWIDAGSVVRGAGDGPQGKGWPVEPPILPGMTEPLPPFYLLDQSAAMLLARDRSLRIAGESFPPYLDQRRGRPGSPVSVTLTVTELAVDAEAVGNAMFALGPRNGTMLLGGLKPRPAVRWLLGGVEGPPLLTDENWSLVGRP